MTRTHTQPSPADSVVVGRITEVTKLAGYAPSSGDEASTLELAFDDPRSRWQAVRLEVEVDETVVGEPFETAHVGLVVDPSIPFESILAALRSYGDVVLPLVSQSPVFASHPELFAIVDDGELFMDLRVDQLTLPFLKPDEAKMLLASVTKLSSLRSAAR
jgi:hypothetical protein